MLSEGAETNSLTDTGKKRRLAFLDLLLKVQLSGGKNELTDEDIREEVGFLLASHWLENLSFEKNQGYVSSIIFRIISFFIG